MLVLSIDTSSPVLTVAIGDEAVIVDEVTLWLPRGHMAKLIPVIDGLLTSFGYTIDDVTHVVIGSGPGSYTGLRIGMVIARTLAQMLNVPILGIPSLDAIAYRNRETSGIICPIIDAKRAEVYAAFYRPNDDTVERFSGFHAIKPDELAELIQIEGYERIVFAGDAVKLYREVIEGILQERAEFAPEEAWWPTASDLIALAKPRLRSGDFDELYQLSPIYVRLSQAEEMWEQRQKEQG